MRGYDEPVRRYTNLAAAGKVHAGIHGPMEFAYAPDGRLAYRFVTTNPTGEWIDLEDQCNDPDGGGARAGREAITAYLADR
jgi:hypothetical protein